MSKTKAPLIIIGMHRSGTSLIAGLLHKAGIFMGYKQDDNNESVFFQRLNEFIFRQANASWDNPHNFLFIDQSFKDYARRLIELHLKGLRRVQYLGPLRFFRYKTIKDIDFPWGWKDPRNTFTVDIWKEIFPEARIVHVFRNPVDVAESLKNREHRLRNKGLGLKARVKEFLLKGKVYPCWSVRVLDILEGINLWCQYTEKALSLDKEFGDRILHIRYETLLETPEESFKRILKFAGFDMSKDISIIVREVKKDRRYAFLNNGELLSVYEKIKDLESVKRLGYHTII
jgi:hypothetical protein